METSGLTKRKPGQQMTTDERTQFIGDLVEKMLEGLYSENQLSQMLNIDRSAIRKYKPAALRLITAAKLDQANIRALQIQRAYARIEKLTMDLDTEGLTIKEKMAVHGQITKLEQHLALITGLNVETKVNVDHKKLVIVRAHPDSIKKALNPVIDIEPERQYED